MVTIKIKALLHLVFADVRRILLRRGKFDRLKDLLCSVAWVSLFSRNIDYLRLTVLVCKWFHAMRLQNDSFDRCT